MAAGGLWARVAVIGAVVAAGIWAAVPVSAATTTVAAVGAAETQGLLSTLFPAAIDNVAAGATNGGIPAGPGCTGGLTYSAAQPVPDSSAAGVTTLLAEETAAPDRHGCVAIARSTVPPGTGARPNEAAASHLAYFAFALTGVVPLVGSDSGATATHPLDLTLAQVQAVYDCTDTHWDQLGATSHAPIVRYWPAPGSATASLYEAVLGFDPATDTTAKGCHNDLTAAYLVLADAEGQILSAHHQRDAFALSTAGAFAHQWDSPARYGPATHAHPANWSPDLTLASVQDLAGVAFHPFADYTAGTGRGHEALDPVTVAEANEWYSHP